MALRVFSIAARGCQESSEELNQFLRSHRVVAVDRKLIVDAGTAYWSFCIEYLERGEKPTNATGNLQRSERSSKSKVDYREILSPDDFAVFARLRELRKQLAAEEAVPVYAVFTNEQLAAIVLAKPRQKSDLRQVDGIGEGRLEKYGARVLGALAGPTPPVTADPESSGDAADDL